MNEYFIIILLTFISLLGSLYCCSLYDDSVSSEKYKTLKSKTIKKILIIVIIFLLLLKMYSKYYTCDIYIII